MKKDFLILSIIAVLIVVAIFGVDIQSVEDYYATHLDTITPDSKTVFFSIDCKAVLDNWDELDESLKSEKFIPFDGVILPVTEYALRQGDSVYKILDRVARSKKINISYAGSYGSTVYVQGINHIYEFSCGAYSGWRYSVNGEYPSTSCNMYVPKDGDLIEWKYTCDLNYL